MDKATLERLARQKLADAELLLAEGRYANAYYLAGYAGELALKALVARRFASDAIPDKGLVNAVYTHDLAKLLELADLSGALKAQAKARPRLVRNWSRLAEWNESSRYEETGEEAARSIVGALIDDEEGVFPWIATFW